MARPEDPEIADFVAYDPETGVFTWKRRCGHRGIVGRIAGGISRAAGRAYYVIRFRRRGYKAHRVAFLIMTGAWPAAMADHRDGDTLNNKWSNLREASPFENSANSCRRCNNSTGLKGVSRCRDRYYAQIQHRKQKVHLGTFDTAQEAYAAYLIAAERLHGEFRRAA